MDTNQIRLVRPDPVYADAPRQTCFADGIEFQDFVCKELAKRNVILQNLQSKKYQFAVGENLQGFEIKLDMRCSDTKRLSIELAEKTRADHDRWTPSGIMRDDNAWLYIQGNYDHLFIFSKKFLRMLWHSRSDKFEWREQKTIQTFFLPFEDAMKYCALHIDLTEIPF